MSIKLIAVDIDGTLLNSQRQVTPEVFQAIQEAKAAGVKVVIATGRPIPGVLPLLEELNLNQDGDYVITFNGGLVQETSTGNELIRETLSYEDYLDIEVLANKLGVHSHAITKEGQVIGLCTVDLSGNNNYLYGLAVAEDYRGQGYGSYLAKSVVNQLIAHNDKSFQIAVEDDNVGAKHLYEKIGFVKQTQVVYLKQKE